VNQLPQRAVVRAEAGGVVEAAQAGAARDADTGFIERPWIQEGRAANRAEVVGVKRLRRTEAVVTDWNPGELCERAVTNAAVIREKQREKCVRNPAKET